MAKQITPDDVRKMLQQANVPFQQTFGQAPKAPSLPKAEPIQSARSLDPMLSPSLPSFDPTRTTTPPVRQESVPSNDPSWGEVLGTSLKTGTAQMARSIPTVLDAFGVEKRNAPFFPDLSENRDYVARARQEQQNMMSQIDTSTLGGKAKNLGASLVGTLPGMALDMGLIMATGGASAAPKLATTAATTASMATQALGNIMKSPATANRITRYFAQSYNDSKDQGASSEDAIRNAILYSVPSAIIEASGGIDNVAVDIAKGINKTTAGAFVKELLLKTAPEEAREEMLQEIVGGASRKATYEPSLPLVSTKEDAVVNPAQIAEAGAMGYLGGAILGGGMGAIQNARLPRFNAQSTQQPTLPTVEPTPQPIQQTQGMADLESTPEEVGQISKEGKTLYAKKAFLETKNEDTPSVKSSSFEAEPLSSDINIPQQPQQMQDTTTETDDVRIVDGVAYYKEKGATTAPIGQAWFSNRESRFGGERKSIMLPDKLQQPTTDFAKPLSQEQTPTVEQTPTTQEKSAEKPIINLQMFPGENPEYQALVDTYGLMPEGETPYRNVQVPKRTSKNTKVGRAYRTVMEAKATPDALVTDLKEDIMRGAADYVPIGNAQVQKKVESKVEKDGFAESYKNWDSVVRGDTAVGAEQIVLGEKLYVEAAKQGDYETAKKLVAEIALVARRAGQTVQAMRILKKMTPDGQLYYLTKVVDQLNKEHSKRLNGKAIELSKEAQDRIAKAKTKEELNDAVDQAYNEIAPQVPNTLLDKLNAWRYLAMLGNPRTHIRNIVGNSLFAPVRGVKNLTGMVIEQAIPKDQRTKAILLPGIDKADTDRLRFASKDFDEMAETITGTGKYNPSDIIRDRKKVFSNPLLEWARTTNFNALEVEDRFFLRQAYNSSLAQFMKARGLMPDTMTAKQLGEARKYAIVEAQKATFRDPSKVAKWLSETSKRGTIANLAVEAVMPFKKTPANILKRGVEYSPAGLIKGVYDTLIKVPNGDMTAAEAIDSLASGLSGTGLAILGAWLTSLGVITGAGEEDDRLRSFDEIQGTQNYSLRVGDYFYSLDWAAPAAMPFFAGVEFYEALVKGGEKDPLSKAADALSNMTEPAFNMSMLQGINSTIRSAKYSDQNEIAAIGQNAVANYLSQYVPTLAGQVARTADPVRRNAYYNDKNKNLPQAVQVALNRNIAKLPKFSEDLPAYIDQWGREERNDNWQARAIENFLSPGFVSKTNTTKVDKALRELYDKTGESTLLPSKAPRYISVEGNNIYLTAKQYEKYAKEKGQTSYKYLDNLTSNKEYSKLSDEQKTSLVKKVYEIANAEAKSKVTPYKPSSEVQKIKDAQKQGISISDYLIIKETADTRGKDESGNYVNKPNNSIDQEEAYRRLEQTNLTAKQKEYLYFNAFNTQWKNLPKIK